MKIGIKLLWYFHPDSFLTPFNENTKKIYYYIFYTSISFSHQTLASSATTTAGSYKMLETNGETWDGRSFTRASVGCNREDLWWGRPWYGREVSVRCMVDDDDDMLSSSPPAGRTLEGLLGLDSGVYISIKNRNYSGMPQKIFKTFPKFQIFFLWIFSPKVFRRGSSLLLLK